MIEYTLCFVSFLIGIPLCFRAMASLYAVIDHWYAIRVHYRRVGTSIAVWCTVFAGLGLGLSAPFGTAYWLGAACVVTVHFLLGTLAVVLPRAIKWQEQFEYRTLLKDEIQRRSGTTGASTSERDIAT